MGSESAGAEILRESAAVDHDGRIGSVTLYFSSEPANGAAAARARAVNTSPDALIAHLKLEIEKLRRTLTAAARNAGAAAGADGVGSWKRPRRRTG